MSRSTRFVLTCGVRSVLVQQGEVEHLMEQGEALGLEFLDGKILFGHGGDGVQALVPALVSPVLGAERNGVGLEIVVSAGEVVVSGGVISIDVVVVLL